MFPGQGEWLIILFVVVLLFGVKRLPELGSGLGQAIKNFKTSYKESQSIDITPEGSKKPESDSSASKEA